MADLSIHSPLVAMMIRYRNTHGTINLHPTPPTTSIAVKKNKGTEKLPERKQKFEFRLVERSTNRCAEALTTGHLSDVKFLIESNGKVEEFQAHKLILAFNSKVFHAMFYGTLPEEENQVKIVDVDPEAFGIFLRFMYSNVCPINMDLDLTFNVLFCARKYDVQELEETIAEHLQQDSNKKNVLRILEVAIFFDLKALELQCWEMIDKHIIDILVTPQFTEIQVSTLELLLKRESLNVAEDLLFAGVLKWAKSECDRTEKPQTGENLRKALGNCFQLLRLASMSAVEFADGPGKSGLLTDAEIGNVLLHICSTKVNATPVLFSPIKRNGWSVARAQHFIKCGCATYRSTCFYCKNISTRKRIGENPLAPVFWKSELPQCYCQCRMRGYCPSRNLEPAPRRPFSAGTLALAMNSPHSGRSGN